MASPTRRYTLSLGVVLFGVWLLWSGHYTVLLTTLGGVSTLFVLGLLRRMEVLDRESAPLEPTLRALAYAPWLILEIVKSNIDVARRILDPRLPIDPHIIHVRASQHSDLGRVIYANSITLTPGTVSVDLEGETITIHALTREAAAGVLAGEMDRRCARVEGAP